MSSRAIRALRGNTAALDILSVRKDQEDDDDEEEEEDDDDAVEYAKQPLAFSAIMDDDEDSSGSDQVAEEKSEDKDRIEASDGTTAEATEESRQKEDSGAKSDLRNVAGKSQNVPDLQVVEDNFDDILNEFQQRDLEQIQTETLSEMESKGSMYVSKFRLLLDKVDPRDLDIDYSIRNALHEGLHSSSASSTAAVRRKNRATLLFGPARDGWIRPPHYVGGGLGMVSYDESQRSVPWPYNTIEFGSIAPASSWYAFNQSDSYRRDCADYDLVRQSGDLNALIYFVIHHPFVTSALLQLSTVLYQANHSHEALAMLRRCLWIYDCSSLSSFTREWEDGVAFMDANEESNRNFFNAMLLLMKVSNVASLPRTALTISRFMLSLDPLRDPMRVLLILDQFALACNDGNLDLWLVELIESGAISIVHKDDVGVHHGPLVELPNWSYSYALALFRAREVNDSDENNEKADQALQTAISRFPQVVGLLLQNLEVDTTGRSFRRDWVTVLDFATDRVRLLQNHWSSSPQCDPVILSASLQACDLACKIYTQKQSARLWGADNVLQWLYDNLKAMRDKKDSNDVPGPPNPCVMRYLTANLSDYDNKFELLPADANILDVGLVQHAMIMETRRGRFLRRVNWQGPQDDPLVPRGPPGGMALGRPVIGGPPVNVIDPDWPIMEVFWRSFLPWNRVEGVAPPRR